MGNQEIEKLKMYRRNQTFLALEIHISLARNVDPAHKIQGRYNSDHHHEKEGYHVLNRRDVFQPHYYH